MIQLRQRTIHANGSIIGYQFNCDSLGSRKFTRTVLVESEGSQTGTARVLGRDVRVRRILGLESLWEVF